MVLEVQDIISWHADAVADISWLAANKMMLSVFEHIRLSGRLGCQTRQALMRTHVLCRRTLCVRTHGMISSQAIKCSVSCQTSPQVSSAALVVKLAMEPVVFVQQTSTCKENLLLSACMHITGMQLFVLISTHVRQAMQATS